MGLGTTELIIIFAIILLVFGAGKIPKVARDLGAGIKEFKKTLSGDSSHDEPQVKKAEKPDDGENKA